MSLAYSYLLFIVLAIFLFCYFLGTWVWIKVVERKNDTDASQDQIPSDSNKENRRDFVFVQLAGLVYLFIFLYSAVMIYKILGTTFFVFILCICVCSDIGGYIFGKTVGGKKLTKISPNKTISGSIGSFIFSLTPLLLFNYDLILKNLLFCLIVSLSCQLGDLIISYFKRLNRIKDTGNILPGHGGLLDRIDGIIFAIPTIHILKNYLAIF